MRLAGFVLVVLGVACACGKRPATEDASPPAAPAPATAEVSAAIAPPAAGAPDALEPAPSAGPPISPAAPEVSPSSPPAAAADPSAALLAELGAVAGCPSRDSPHRTWCIAVDGWASGTAPDLPAGDHVWLGLTAAIASGQPVTHALSDHVSLGALAVRNEGGSAAALITSIKPENDEESRMMAEAIFNLALLFKGRAQTVPVPNDLLQYAGTLPAKASHPVTIGARGWRFAGEASAEVRRVGDFWVAIETPREGPPGVFVSIYTDRLEGH
jgi:hypothetical protein